MISRRQFSAVGLASLAALFTAHKAVAELAATTSLRRRGTFAVERLDRIVLVADDIDRLARFYAAIGFVVDDARPAPLHAQLAHARTATSRTMRVGNDTIELVAFDPPGNPLPRPVRSTDPWFQHICLIAPDMQAAMMRLRGTEGWTPISRDGPVELQVDLLRRLGLKSGGLTVFKFRDPDGHALEFASFTGEPPARWASPGPGLLGYDHTALGVADSQRSIDFYRDILGMSVSAQAQSSGHAQETSDDVTDALVDIVKMLPTRVATPHVEFLGYHGAHAHPLTRIGPRDRAATRLVLATRGVTEPQLIQDPDGHWIELVST
jgi:catechol 2,3-dioxygenase-like lactoylglutathione lyase family enzyme